MGSETFTVRISERNGRLRFDVRVQPRASKDEIAGIREGVLRIRLRAPPVDGAANDALISFLADRLGLSRSQVQVVSGLGSRSKVVEVDAKARPALDRIAVST